MPKVDTVPEFDTVRAAQLMSDAVSLIASFYPSGAMEWLREKRKDIILNLHEAEMEADAAALAGDRTRLLRALEVYTKQHQFAFKVYRERPPIINVHADLLPAPPAPFSSSAAGQ